MIDLGFNLVTFGSDQRFISSAAKDNLSKLKKITLGEDSKSY